MARPFVLDQLPATVRKYMGGARDHLDTIRVRKLILHPQYLWSDHSCWTSCPNLCENIWGVPAIISTLFVRES